MGMIEEFRNKTTNPRLRQDFGEQAHRSSLMSPPGLLGSRLADGPTDLFPDRFGFAQTVTCAETLLTKEQLKRSALSDFLQTLS